MINDEEEKTQKRSEEMTTSGTKMSSVPPQGLGSHRLHRSSVRPFFCCGSQLSLNSTTDFVDGPSQVTEMSDISDEVTDLMSDISVTKHSGARNTCINHKEKTCRKKFWTIKLRGKLHVSKRSRFQNQEQVLRPSQRDSRCECTSYRRTADDGEITVEEEEPSTSSATPLLVEYNSTSIDGAESLRNRSQRLSAPELDRPSSEVIVTFRGPINFDELYPTEDVDERRIAERAREMEEGVDISDFWVSHNILGATGGGSRVQLVSASSDSSFDQPSAMFPKPSMSSRHSGNFETHFDSDSLCYGECNFPPLPRKSSPDKNVVFRYVPLHSQVDYMHCLVPDILHITKCSFYWGVMDRYQAEKLLENKPEGTFLLRDSAQEEFLFSVSFRRYGRSLHARIEQWNHKFSFDSHDPGVFASDTVCGLIEHYKDPTCCMFFEPMLTSPLHRNFTFSLQHMCRATICDNTTYDGVSRLPLPRALKNYLMYYHYKQKVRVRSFDNM